MGGGGGGGQAGAPHPQTPALTPSLPQFPHSGSEKRLLPPPTAAGKIVVQPRTSASIRIPRGCSDPVPRKRGGGGVGGGRGGAG